MSEPTEVRGVHLFCDDILIGHLETARPTPDPSYRIDGKTYDTISYVSVIEAAGRPGFDVQVKLTDGG